MDIRDDPSTTTTTTDYESGDSEGVDYVYEGQTHVKKSGAEGRGSRRTRSTKGRSRGLAGCSCGAARAGEDKIIVFEDVDTDTEERECRQRYSTRPGPSGSDVASMCDNEAHQKTDSKKVHEGKTQRARSPYIEEYPDEVPRPAILLKEHKISRGSSTSERKHVRGSDDRSLSSGSRSSTPTGKCLPPCPVRRSSKESSQYYGSRRHHLDPHGQRGGLSETGAGNLRSDPGESAVDGTCRSHHPGRGLASTITRGSSRGSAWDERPQQRYSSSWPLETGSHLPPRQPRHVEHRNNNEQKQPQYPDNDDDFDESPPPGRRRRLFSRERGRGREAACQGSPALRGERGHEAYKSLPHQLGPTIPAGSASMSAMDQGRHSVISPLCGEMWQGYPEGWESPSYGNSDIGAPIRLLTMDDIPAHISPPHLLPPPGERREFIFQGVKPSPSPPHHNYHPSIYATGPSWSYPKHLPHPDLGQLGQEPFLPPREAPLLDRGARCDDGRGRYAWPHADTPL